jgi:hypothetical protein
MSYLTFRVEVTRDETQAESAASAEITAYIDRVPETDAPTRGMLTRAAKGVWNSRLQYTGDFDSLTATLTAVEAAFPEVCEIRCYEYTVDDEYPVETAPLLRLGDKWQPVEA